ncbi:MAG: glycosyltransferase family 39 protein, partial [Anaerolineales bacterium]
MWALSPGRVAIAAATVALVALTAVAPAPGLATAVAAGALWYAAWVARRQQLSGQRLCAGVVACGIAAGLLAPALIGATHTANEVLARIAMPGAAVQRRAVLAATLGLALLVMAARSWPERRSDRWFLALLGVPVTIAKLAYVHIVVMEPISDFADMWSLASRIATTGMTAPSNWLEWLFFERILLYLLPLRVLFGPGASAYAIPNVLVGVASAVGAYALTRRWFSRSAARAAFALSLIAPETWLAAEIPTHDIPGAAFTVLALVVLYVAYDRARELRSSALAWGAGWGLLIVALDLQRTTGVFFLLTCGLLVTAAAALDPPRRAIGHRRRRLVFAATSLLLLPALTFQASRMGLRAAGLKAPSIAFAPEQKAGLFVSTASWSDGVPW